MILKLAMCTSDKGTEMAQNNVHSASLQTWNTKLISINSVVSSCEFSIYIYIAMCLSVCLGVFMGWWVEHIIKEISYTITH